MCHHAHSLLCLLLLAGAPKSTTEKLQRIINAAAQLVTNIRKFDRGLTYMQRHVLHWLDVSDRKNYSVCVSLSTIAYMEWHLGICQSCADQFLHFKDDVTCVLMVPGHLDFPQVRCVTYSKRSYVGPSAWNSLRDDLGKNSLSLSVFRSKLKSHVFSNSASSALEVFER